MWLSGTGQLGARVRNIGKINSSANNISYSSAIGSEHDFKVSQSLKIFLSKNRKQYFIYYRTKLIIKLFNNQFRWRIANNSTKTGDKLNFIESNSRLKDPKGNNQFNAMKYGMELTSVSFETFWPNGRTQLNMAQDNHHSTRSKSRPIDRNSRI
jgi:hypothetical protein